MSAETALKKLFFREAISRALREEMRRDQRVIGRGAANLRRRRRNRRPPHRNASAGSPSPESAKEAASKADGVVVASTVLKILIDGGDMDAAAAKAETLISAAHGA